MITIMHQMAVFRMITEWLDDFLIRALIAGFGIAIIAGPLGCFIIWRRMAYFGDTLAHASIAGIALSLWLNIAPFLGVFAAAIMIALALSQLQKRNILSNDSLLGLLSHASLAIGIIMISLLPNQRFNLSAMLFGDILAVSSQDLIIIFIVIIVAGLAMYRYLPTLLAETVSPDIALAEGLPVEQARLVYTLSLAATIAIAIEICGALLITAMLIIPAATARQLASGPVMMIGLAQALGLASVTGGLLLSNYQDTPAGPSIILAATLMFLVCYLYRSNRH